MARLIAATVEIDENGIDDVGFGGEEVYGFDVGALLPPLLENLDVCCTLEGVPQRAKGGG